MVLFISRLLFHFSMTRQYEEQNRFTNHLHFFFLFLHLCECCFFSKQSYMCIGVDRSNALAIFVLCSTELIIYDWYLSMSIQQKQHEPSTIYNNQFQFHI